MKIVKKINKTELSWDLSSVYIYNNFEKIKYNGIFPNIFWNLKLLLLFGIFQELFET